ncbi:MAG: protein kinase [Bryobacteraceae bacterium]
MIDKLGEGGMGEVWRARDERLSRTVAIKILPSDVADDPSRRVRFEQEARALAALNHPNIVTVYDVGQDEGRAYIVSELVEGESLRSVLDRGPLPVRKAIEVAVQMAEGMAAAHALGIVHRDLKPENAMMTRGGQVKLLDFGLAKQTITTSGDKTSTMALSEPGMVMGTVGYMSPEQVRAEPVDARSDIFSFGCVLYEMIAGQRAFRAGSSIETMHAILNAEPPELENEQARMPAALGTIVRRCLEKRPEQRFQSASDLAFALRSIAGTSMSGVQPAILAPPAARKKTWRWAIAAVVGGMFLFTAGFWMRNRTVDRQRAEFQRVTFRKGYVTAARFTSDGRNIVYAANWDGTHSSIYLTVPGSAESRDLNLPADAELMSVSSKEEIAFLTAPFGDYGTGTLAVGSISGGQMRPMLEGVLAADWAPDGSSMAVLRRVNGVNRLEYPIGTVLVDKILWPLWMIRISPDGSRVAYAGFASGRRVGITMVDRARKQQFLGTVSGHNSTGENSSLSWTRNGDEIWFRSFNSGEPGTVFSIDTKGRHRTVVALPSRVSFYDISKDGQALLSTGALQLGILGEASDGATERDLSCLDSGSLRGISDDGQLIVANIAGQAGGWKGSIYVRKTDGSPAVRIGDGQASGLSPDGKWISGYVVNEAGERRWVLIPTGPGEELSIKVPGMGEANVMGWLDGDQRYLVFGRPHNQLQCLAFDARSGKVQPVCPEGIPDSVLIIVSPDRKQVLSAGPHGGWFAYPVDGGTAQEVHGIGSDEVPVAWRADSRSLYIRPRREDEKRIPVSIVDIATGRRSPWKQIQPSQPVVEIHDLYITPDGRAYAYNFVTMQSDLYVARGVN